MSQGQPEDSLDRPRSIEPAVCGARLHAAQRGGGAWALQDGARRALATAVASRTIVVEDGKSTGARREHAARFAARAIGADRWDVRFLGTTLALA